MNWGWLGRRETRTALIMYPLFDCAAAILSGEFSGARFLGMAVVGSGLYAWEVPAVLQWIDRSSPDALPELDRAWRRTGLALVYFNPLWVIRHLCLIFLISGRLTELNFSILGASLKSWLVNLPLLVVGTYLIQKRVPPMYRFASNLTFAAVLAASFALGGALLR